MNRFARLAVHAVMAAGVLFASAAGQAQGIGQGQPMILPVDPVRLKVVDNDPATPDPTFAIEVADNDRERAAGLMFRRAMPDDRGMLFVFQETQPLSFWMKNTPMPLDLLFIGADGKVKAILPGTPFSEAPIGPPSAARFVLELKAGTARKTGIEVGERVRHPLVDAVAGK